MRKQMLEIDAKASASAYTRHLKIICNTSFWMIFFSSCLIFNEFFLMVSRLITFKSHVVVISAKVAIAMTMLM